MVDGGATRDFSGDGVILESSTQNASDSHRRDEHNTVCRRAESHPKNLKPRCRSVGVFEHAKS